MLPTHGRPLACPAISSHILMSPLFRMAPISLSSVVKSAIPPLGAERLPSVWMLQQHREGGGSAAAGGEREAGRCQRFDIIMVHYGRR